ncbi:YceI family protein [soil metagenome]
MRRLFTFILPLLIIMSFTVADLKPADTDQAVTFTIKNFGINTKGEIKGLKGGIKWDPAKPASSAFNVTADVNTISTGIDMRDSHLKKEEYFDVAKFPAISFASTAVNNGNVTGNLTIKGITKSINFPFTVTPSGGGYIFEGEFTIDRKEFNVGSGSMSLGNSVTVHLKVQAK